MPLSTSSSTHLDMAPVDSPVSVASLRWLRPPVYIPVVSVAGQTVHQSVHCSLTLQSAAEAEVAEVAVSLLWYLPWPPLHPVMPGHSHMLMLVMSCLSMPLPLGWGH